LYLEKKKGGKMERDRGLERMVQAGVQADWTQEQAELIVQVMLVRAKEQSSLEIVEKAKD